MFLITENSDIILKRVKIMYERKGVWSWQMILLHMNMMLKQRFKHQ